MRKLEKQEWNSNGVTVTVYEESSKVGSRPRKIKTINSNRTARSCNGYDRRAELLAYAHQLRNVGYQQVHQDHTPTDSYLPKPKKRRRWFCRLKSLKFSFGRLFGGEKKKAWRYENIDAISSDNIHRFRCQGRNRWSRVSKRLRRVLKQFSCGCKCSKRYNHSDEQHQDLHKPQSS